mgnify:FL=1
MAKNRERHRAGGKKKKLIIAAAVIVVAAAVFFGLKSAGGKKAQQTTASETDVVARGDVSLTITGSAAIEPFERYEIIAKVSGDITECNYEVGDTVEKGTVLYRFDTSDNDISLEKQELSLEQSKTSYESALKDADKLRVTAKASGVISGLDISAGDDVKNGDKIAEISNTKLLKVSLPFNEAQAANIRVGDAAYVSSSVHMSNVSGTVTHKDANSHAGSDGARLYNITVSFENPGAFYEGMSVGGAVGDMISSGSGKVEVSDSGTAVAECEGTVARVNYKNGDYVEKGAVIATLTSDTVSDSIKNSNNNYKNAQLSMRDAREKLDDYILTSPISGTVITKNSKAGDTIDRSNSTQTLMVVADVSKLKFNLEIDELDVDKVSTGQKVEITCDALPDESFVGEITNLSVEGTSSNGVTTYTAEVVINEPGNLRPSMNVDASVVAESSENTLYVPSEDVKQIGNTYYVFKKSDAAATEQKRDNGDKSNGKPNGKPDGKPGDMPDATKSGDGAQGGAPDSAPGGDNSGGSRLPQAPDGFETVAVEVGVMGTDYTEILSGLSEGDEIYKQTTTTSSSDRMGMMMGGGMGGGPGGGLGGGPGGGPGGR